MIYLQQLYIKLYFKPFVKPFFINFSTILASIAHNVPAVYDVLAARISKHVVFAGPTKCGGGFAWE
jgi:hypothetical protein